MTDFEPSTGVKIMTDFEPPIVEAVRSRDGHRHSYGVVDIPGRGAGYVVREVPTFKTRKLNND